MRFNLALKILLGLGAFMLPLVVGGSEWKASRLLEFTTGSCRAWEESGAPAPGYATEPATQSKIMFRGAQIGTRFRLLVDEAYRVEFDVLDRSGRATRFIGSLYNNFGDPLLLISLGSDCAQQVARQINYTENGQAISVVSLDAGLIPKGEPDWLNPPLEFIDRETVEPLKHPGDAGPLRVGMVDSGVNYLLPEINRRLARDQDNRLIGFDFWDMDDLPFDAHPVNSGFFVQRHGTRTATLLLREAPAIELVPYRYPRPDMSRMRALVEHAARNGVSILGMPLGSNRLEDWGAFERSARQHPHMLFVVSAGNDGRNIDERPVYPAALDLDNLLVVTSANAFVRPAERTNWGRVSVDYLVPAERIAATDFSGKPTRVSGSSYAVARVTALAARMKMQRPYLRASEIIAELRKRYRAASDTALEWVSSGYIGDPLAGNPVTKELLTQLEFEPAAAGADLRMSLEVLRLDPRWSGPEIESALYSAYDILGQCGIAADEVSIYDIKGDDYLRDLSVGGAHTLLEAADTPHATIVFARDTRMQAQFSGEAFGLANTGMRPWLANSVWLMRDVDDPGIALAHELYHVLDNNGDHVEGSANLMQGYTRPDSTHLTPSQCRRARATGVSNGLLLD